MNETMIATAEAVEEVMQGKPYTFRTLEGKDMFLMLKILKKIGIKEFNALFQNDGIKNLVAARFGNKEEKAAAAKGKTVTYIEVVLEVADVVVGNLANCETEINQMLANVSGMKPEEVASLDFATYGGMIMDFIQKEEFKDFIKVVSASFK